MVRLGWKAGRSRSVAQTASTAPTRNIPTATRTLTAVSCEGVVEADAHDSRQRHPRSQHKARRCGVAPQPPPTCRSQDRRRRRRP
jgi:hypothetical protein